MLFKLSLRNLRKSLKDYAIYFFTLILSVAVFYIFNAIEESTVLMELSTYQNHLAELLTKALGSLSVFVCIVLAFLIIFANQFLMKRRKKEFGTYMLLGMKKQSISKILLIETFYIGLLSLLIGLIIGVVSSQFMSIMVAKMFEVNLSRFEFVFSSLATVKTIFFFGIIYFIVMLFNTFSISKCKLINLLNAMKQGETIKVKSNLISSVIFLSSIAILSYAYYYVLSDRLLYAEVSEVLIPIALGCIGTIMFFYSIAGLLLNLAKSNKRFYYKNLNVFVLRQISSKINTMVISMSVISILLFLTICILSSGLSIKSSSDKMMKELVPVDLTVEAPFFNQQDIEDYKDVGMPQEQIDQYSLSMDEKFMILGVDVNTSFKEKINFNSYAYDTITYADLFGSEAEENIELLMYGNREQKEQIIRISDYNKVAELFGKETYILEDNEYMMVTQKLKDLRDYVLAKNTKLRVGDRELTPKYKSAKDGFIRMSSFPSNQGFTLVPDDVVSDEFIQSVYFLANYAEASEVEINELNEKLSDMRMNTMLNDISIKNEIYESSVGLGTIATFIGLYLGIIFLISGAAILALKELSESSDNVGRYEILRKIGTSEKMINRSLFNQIGVFFALPLLLACVHSYFGILFANKILLAFGKIDLFEPILFTSLFIIFIYGGYFLITYLCSKIIIENK